MTSAIERMGVALVADGVSHRAGSGLFKNEAEEAGGIEAMHGWPALGAVADVAGDPAAAGGIDEHRGESTTLPSGVDRSRESDDRGADSALGKVDDGLGIAAAAAHGSVGGKRILFGRGASGHGGRTGRDDQWPAASFEGVTEDLDSAGLPRHRLPEVVEVGAEGEVDYPVGLDGAIAQTLGVIEITTEHRGSGSGEGCRRSVGSGQAEDLMARGHQLGDEHGTDPSGGAGNENTHV